MKKFTKMLQLQQLNSDGVNIGGLYLIKDSVSAFGPLHPYGTGSWIVAGEIKYYTPYSVSEIIDIIQKLDEYEND